MSDQVKSLLFGLPIFAQSKEVFFSFLRDQIESKNSKTQLIFTPNSEQVIQARADKDFAKTLKQGDLLLPDGSGLVWANRILRFKEWLLGQERSIKIKEWIPGVDVVNKLLMEAAKYNYKTLIVGGRDYASFWGKSGGQYLGEAFESEESLIELKKNLYWTEAYQDKYYPLTVEDESLEKILKRLKPQLVFVALGAPDQEQWLVKWRSILEQSGVKLAMAVGGSFDFLFAKVRRAPKIMQRLGFEWLWRLFNQPWRFRRQLRLAKFISLVFKDFFGDLWVALKVKHQSLRQFIKNKKN